MPEMNKPRDGESEGRGASLFGLSENASRELLVLLIAAVALLGTVAAALHVADGAKAARASRDGRAYTFSAIGKGESGRLLYLYERTRLAAYEGLVTEWSLELRLAEESGSAAEAEANEEAAARLSQVIADSRSLSQILSPPYYDETTFMTDVLQFGVDYLVVPPTLTLEKEAAKRAEADAWGSKSERHVVAIAVLAVSLFLLALALTARGRLKELFFVVGLAIAVAAVAFVLATLAVPVPRIPEESLTLYASGTGDAYYAEILSLNAAYAQAAGRADQAIDRFSQAIALRPEYAAAYQGRGGARLLKAEALVLGDGDSQAASAELASSILDLNQAVRLGRGDKVTWPELSLAAFLAERYPESTVAAEKGLALAPDLRLRLCPYLVLGLLGEGRTDQARQALEAGLAWGAEHPMAGDGFSLRVWIHGLAEIERGRPLPGLAEVVKRLKEASVALAYRRTAAVSPTPATVSPLAFEALTVDAEGNVLTRQPATTFPQATERVGVWFSYQGVPSGALVVLKVYRNGLEQTALTQVETWTLPASGLVERVVHSAFERDFVGLGSGRYVVEVYVDANLVSQGEFTIE